MNRDLRPHRRVCLLTLAWALLAPGMAPAEAPAADDQGTRATMGELVEALSIVLPLSLDADRFAAPENRATIESALRTLATSGARVESHGQFQDAGFGFLSRSLARDTAEIRRRFDEEKFAEARFLLHELTDNCVACHSRLPDDRSHPLGRRLFAQVEIAEMPLDERVTLETATRQFDQALASYEELFARPDVSPGDLDLMGYLDSYLEIALRVKNDPVRPIAPLKKLAARKDTRAPLRATLESWIASLEELAKRPAAPPTLERGRALVAEAEDRARFPDDRRALPIYVAASGVLHQYVSAEHRTRDELAESYYLLGVIESHVGRSFWLSQTEHFLEASIRTSPGSRFASEAFDLLEEFVVSGYTGSSGSHVPTDVQERLDALRALIDSARPS
jgi:hypothetical protein